MKVLVELAEIEYIIDNEDLENRNGVTDYQSYAQGAEQMRFQLRKAIKNYICVRQFKN